MEFGEYRIYESASAAGGPEKEDVRGWLVGDKKELEGLKPELLVEVKLANRRIGVALTPEYLETARANIENLVREKKVELEDAIPWLAKIDSKHAELAKKARPQATGTQGEASITRGLDRVLRSLNDENREFYEQQMAVLRKSLSGFNTSQVAKIVAENVAKGMQGLEALQKAQNELLRRAGFSGFVSAMDARAGINVQQFDTELPVWYESLSHEWKDIIRTNLGVLLGSYLKFRSAVKGAETIIASEDIAIYREALADMWEIMPGFRVAMATMTKDLFVTHPDLDVMILSEEGAKILKDLPGYKERLIASLTKHIAKNEANLLNPKFNRGGPENLRADVAARFAVSAVWDLLYLGGAPDSGDTKSRFGNDKKGKNLSDVQAFCPSVRAFYLPWDQANSKYILGKEDPEGTDEGWGGPLGDWMAERIRHDPEFKKLFEKKQGITRLMPERLMYSMFDLTYFEKKRKLPNGKEKSVSVSEVLLKGGGGKKALGNGLYDYKRPEGIDFRGLRFAELWGGYSDTMDSGFKVYNAIIGRADKEFDRLKLSNALSKLRKAEGLEHIYRGEKGEFVLASAVIAMAGGPIKFTSEVVLPVEDATYDLNVYELLSDDRLFASLEPGARKRIYNILHANDVNTMGGALISMLAETPIIGERRRIRRAAGRTAKRYLGVT